MDDVVALPPFTAGMRAAIRECRFKTVNTEHTMAWIMDSDLARIEGTGCHFTRYERAPQTNPGVFDYEARSADPRVVEYVASL